MGVSRDCGHFLVSLNISGGFHNASGQLGRMDKEFQANAGKVLIKIKEKHEKALLAEWCESIGWDEEKAAAAVRQAQKDRDELLEADRKGREEKRKRRTAARM